MGSANWPCYFSCETHHLLSGGGHVSVRIFRTFAYLPAFNDNDAFGGSDGFRPMVNQNQFVPTGTATICPFWSSSNVTRASLK
jgi:hypothetical protein